MPRLVKRIPEPSTNGNGKPSQLHAENGHAAVLTEVRRLMSLGYWVVPCNGKKPVIKGWGDRQLTAAEIANAMIGSTRNIAIVLNRCELIDVECDSDVAEAALVAMCGGRVPVTPTWQSRRGKHRLFRRPSGLPQKAKLEIDGVEFRIGNCKGAVSLVPPSITDGFKRQWLPGRLLGNVEPAELPAGIVERLRTPAPRPANPEITGRDLLEGERNNTLFKHACHLTRTGMTAPSVEATLQEVNKARCKPPLLATEVGQIANSARKQGTQSSQKNGQILLRIALANTELWHTPEGASFATIQQNGHREHWRVRSTEFKQWLARQFWEQVKNVPGSQTMQDVINLLEGKARFDGQPHPVFIRVAGHEESIYIDLCDDRWRAVEIDSHGWRVVNEPPVRFRRTKGMLSLSAPEPGGSMEDLRRFVNVVDEQWPLFVAWQIGALRPTGPYAILKLLGEQGSAKTTTAEIARKNIDPNTAPLRRPPKTDRDLMIAANNGWVVAFDNLSYVNPELSDALCCLASGGGFATRTLYTDEDETILVAERPIILNGIEDMATRTDLLDRCLIIEMPRIDPARRRDEQAFWREFSEAQPRIFGALLNAASSALRNLQSVKDSKTAWPRMADFAQWCVAAEQALGLKPGDFLFAYSLNRAAANRTALESSPVVNALMAMLDRKPSFVGTATELLNKLSSGVDTRAKGWPKNSRALSGILNRLAPNLRATGIAIDQDRKLWRVELPAKPQCTQKIAPKPAPRPIPKKSG